MPLLETIDMSVTFGGLRAVDDVSLVVEQGTLVGLIGPNGAGKTTFIDGLTGFVPAGGRITFDGRDLSGMAAHQRADAGLVRTWQSLELFDDLTVNENLQVAGERASAKGVLADLFGPMRRSGRVDQGALLRLLDLDGIGDRLPTELSQGQRKLVGVARALAARPKLVLMDEPAAGLDTGESRELGVRLRRIVDSGTTVFLVDHDMSLVLTVCDYIYVIEFGRLLAQGTPAEIRSNEQVIAAYLGEQGRKDVEAAKAALAAVPLDVAGS